MRRLSIIDLKFGIINLEFISVISFDSHKKSMLLQIKVQSIHDSSSLIQFGFSQEMVISVSYSWIHLGLFNKWLFRILLIKINVSTWWYENMSNPLSTFQRHVLEWTRAEGPQIKGGPGLEWVWSHPVRIRVPQTRGKDYLDWIGVKFRNGFER